MTFMSPLVGKHGLTYHVANGEYVRYVRSHLFIYFQKAFFVDVDSCFFGFDQETVGRSTNGY